MLSQVNDLLAIIESSWLFQLTPVCALANKQLPIHVCVEYPPLGRALRSRLIQRPRQHSVVICSDVQRWALVQSKKMSVGDSLVLALIEIAIVQPGG